LHRFVSFQLALRVFICVWRCFSLPTEDSLAAAATSLCLFWKHLPQATWSNDGKVLQLAEGTHFLGREEYGDKLMLRDCYSDFETMINEHFARSGKGFAVIGNPGKVLAGKGLLARVVDCSV
jgi:hypothetical protein